MKRRPEGSAWLTRSWIWPALGNNCSYGLWREVLTPPPPLCILCASCPYTVDPWVCHDPHCPQRGFCWAGAQAALRGAWECVGCFLLFPSSCWPLSGWEQGVRTGVLGRGCRSPLWLVLGGPPSCSLCLGGAPGEAVLGQGLQQELLGLVGGCSVAVRQGEQGGGRSVLFSRPSRSSLSRRQSPELNPQQLSLGELGGVGSL